MNPLSLSNGALCIEAMPLQSIAEQFGTPCYVYSRAAVVDAAMNDLLRPRLYEAWHDIVPVRPRDATPMTYDVVGPVCESGDFLGLERSLSVQPGDLLAILSAGA